MQNHYRKPRLLFFQGKQTSLPGFLKLHQNLQVKCLSENFEVVLINQDCDYQQMCDVYNPDVSLFEVGYKSTIPNKLTIKNTSTHPDVPKLGLHNGDGWCECRVGLFYDMQNWGIETVFSISVTTAEYTPIIAENLFVWPNFIDADIYHDYKQVKNIPVLFNGSMISLYPWRQKIYQVITENYPPEVLPHLGYGTESTKMIFGEPYAKIINRSFFVPACGTITKEVVRKHFEVPGSRSCLITERTPALEAAGFIDMENCVFADENNVLDKLEHLFNNRIELQRITDAGYDLVHSRHTLKNRNQIFEWYELNKKLGSSQKIIQTGPFESLSIVEDSTKFKNDHIISKGLLNQLLKNGDEKLGNHNYQQAEQIYLACLQYIPWMSEPKLKLAICYLYKGDANKAYKWVTEPIHNCLGNYSCKEPDPIEWAYLIICLLCQGNLLEASIRSNQYLTINHPELQRIRWVVKYLLNYKDYGSFPESYTRAQRNSIHQISSYELKLWMGRLITMLSNCNQIKYAQLMTRININGHHTFEKSGLTFKENVFRALVPLRISFINQLNKVFQFLGVPNRNTGMPSIYLTDYMIRLAKWTRLDSIKLMLLKYKSH